MRNFLIVCTLLVTFLQADRIKNKTLACPSVMLLQKAGSEDFSDILKLEQYSIANNCVILSREDRIEVLDYEQKNAQDIYQKILYKGTELYLLTSMIEIEQDGKRNILKF